MLPRGAGLALALLALPAQAEASEALWALLKSGGQVVIMRHAATEPTPGDRDTMRLEDCSTQRNLSPSGRDEAKRIGSAFKASGITVDDVRSSLWCRCLDTAELAFGRVEPLSALNGGPRRDAALVAARAREVRALLGTAPAGGNLVLVTHNINIRDATGESPEEGQLVIFTPLGGDRFTTVGRLTPGGLRCDPRSGRPC
jgi:broad specificity phosphatase PhoE